MIPRLQVAFGTTILCAALGARCGDFNFNPIIAPGVVPPPGLGVTRDGDPVETKQFAGKVLIVTFWASWCGPCLQELPKLEGIQRAAGKDNIQVVAVNVEDRDQFRRLHNQLSPTFKVLLTHDWDKSSHDAYGVNGIPHMLIIGRDGRVQKMHRGYDERALDTIVAEINAALAGK